MLALAAIGTARSLRRRTPATATLLRGGGSAPVADPGELERLAAAAERAGAYGEAVRLRFRAGLLSLDQLGELHYTPAIRTAEASRALRSAAFDELARSFERVAYGDQAADEAAATRLDPRTTLAVLDPSVLTPADLTALRAFVAAGGTLVAGGAAQDPTPWLAGLLSQPPRWSASAPSTWNVSSTGAYTAGVGTVFTAGAGAFGSGEGGTPLITDGRQALLEQHADARTGAGRTTAPRRADRVAPRPPHAARAARPVRRAARARRLVPPTGRHG